MVKEEKMAEAKKINSKRSLRTNNLIQLVLVLAIIALLNILGQYVFTRIDLTTDKRYTLSDETIDLIENLDDVVYIELLLEGDIPPGYNRLKKATKEFFDNLIAYSGNNIQYTVFDPLENTTNPKEKNDIHMQLFKKGIRYEYVKGIDSEENWEQKVVYPAAILRYRDKEISVNLIDGEDDYTRNPGELDRATLNNCVQRLEYKFITAIRKLTTKTKRTVAFLEGHGELPEIAVADIFYELVSYYDVVRVKLDENLSSLTMRDSVGPDKYRVINKYDVLVIAKPDSAYSERDKFILDQYIMRGGKILWFIDHVEPTEDSLSFSPITIGMAKDVNLADQLYKYGARINPNIIIDKQCGFIPIPVSNTNPPRYDPRPWYYYPLISSGNEHVITKDIDYIKTEFPSVVDTVGESPSIKKTILLKTSQNSDAFITPVEITVEYLYKNPMDIGFKEHDLPIAVLLEGKFESLYKNRIPPEIANSKEIAFLPNSVETSMIVVGDGDIIKNYYRLNSGNPYPLPLGADRSNNVVYKGNKEFVMNAVNYLVGDTGYMGLRTKKFKQRFLNKMTITKDRFKWQVINSVLPILIIIVFGFIFTFFRKRKFSAPAGN